MRKASAMGATVITRLVFALGFVLPRQFLTGGAWFTGKAVVRVATWIFLCATSRKAMKMLVIPNLLTAQEMAVVRDTLRRVPFVDGTVSGKKSLKNNLQADQSHPEVQQATRAIVGKLMSRREFTSFAIPKNVILMFNRYEPGMTYKDHMDAALMGPSQAQALRADLSFTLFLTDPAEYEGGEFVLQTPYGANRIKHPAGTFMVYPSTMLHRVDPIQQGTRWCAVGWVQSLLRLAEHRVIVHQLDELRYRMSAALPADSPFPEEFAAVYQNLLRLWAEV